MENLRSRINVQIVNNEKDYLKYTSKPSYILRKIFSNNLVVIPKNKLALKLNKLAYIYWNAHIRIIYSIKVRISS